MLAKGGPRVEAAFLRSFADGSLTEVDLEPGDFARTADLVETYADFPLGTTDALEPVDIPPYRGCAAPGRRPAAFSDAPLAPLSGRPAALPGTRPATCSLARGYINRLLVIALAERLEITEIATLDRRHLTAVRPHHTEALTLLP